MSVNPIYLSRRRTDMIVRVLCLSAAIFGVTWLALILLGLLLFVLTFFVLSGARLMLMRLEKKAGN